LVRQREPRAVFSERVGRKGTLRDHRPEPTVGSYRPTPAPHSLSSDDVCALTAYILDLNDVDDAIKIDFARKRPLTRKISTRPGLFQALTLALLFGTALAAPVHAQSAAAEGQKIAFDRGKGNCLTCHVIKGGDLPGSIGPQLVDIKSKYPNRDDLIAIVSDETKRNPQTVMPPFGRNRILTEQEINAVVDFLQTL
jgi:L-cysteine S-thiosulfotransferase